MERVLPLTHWLGAETAHNIDQGQARTRLICTFVGLSGFVLAGFFGDVPAGIVATSIVFPLYAIAIAVHAHLRQQPSRARRAIGLLMDNLVNCYIASFGGPFAIYVCLNFLTTIGWGLRYGRHYLCLATVIASAGMLWNLAFSAYWQENLLFGGAVMFGMLAASLNTATLLHRIEHGNRRVAEKMDEIAQLAWRDPLTRLSNRVHFRERLTQALSAAGRSRTAVALLLFDLDGFKAVNDTLGHEAGDRLLQEIAARVGRQVRQADSLARWGGDEFVLLMEGVRERADAVRVAEMVLQVVRGIDIFPGFTLHLGASIGIVCGATGWEEKRTPEELMRECDKAMYEAKRAGKDCYRFAVTPA
jgi:diguanylate cyclase (GGDEF)-like protein